METINTRKLAAEKAVEYVQNGMIVGLGTGTTAYWAIQLIGQRMKDGLNIKGIATSLQSEQLARELQIPIITFAETHHIDVTIDGADEADHNLNVIKGGGGALLREKIVGSATKLYIIIADESKLVDRLGAFSLPVEVVQFGWEMIFDKIRNLGCRPQLRKKESEPYITDNGNYILDCAFGTIHDPDMLHRNLNAMPGVVENGLFLGMADMIIFGCKDGTTKAITKKV